MASTRKKQDDKHLKILRELVSIASNKQCFDCHQRGPTYVNMTIGSYVCTTCSGMLRGLTPPHRVKSISMATFNQEELEMMKTRGNEYCRGIWLGLYDSNSQDTKDEQQIKDFMIAKYEKKRYYLDPAIAATTTNNGGPASFSPNTTRTPTPTSTTRKADTKPLSTLLGSQSKTLVLNMNTSTKSADNMFTPDKSPAEFLADFETPDPFSSSTQFTSNNCGTQASFANFDDNPIFNSFTSHLFDNVMRSESLTPRCNTNRWSMPTSATLSNMYNAAAFPTPPSGKVTSATVFQQQQLARGNVQQPVEDRYAALKDLDSLMKTHQPSEPQPAPTSGHHMNNGFGIQANSVFGSPTQSSGVVNQSAFTESSTANPFTGASANPWGAPVGGQNNPSAASQPGAFGMNPFQPQRAAPAGYATGQAEPSIGVWGSMGMNGVQNGQLPNGGHNGGIFTSSQSMNFPTKTWNNNSTANPFMLGTSPATTGHSSNPFL